MSAHGSFLRPEVFGILDDLVKAGKLRHYGVSVEKVEEALKAIEFPDVQTVQIIFNIFRQRPAELFFPEAQRRKVGILARVPLASGLLSGKLTPRPANLRRMIIGISTVMARRSTEARHFPAWILRPACARWSSCVRSCPTGATLAQLALRWILEFPGGDVRDSRRQTPGTGGGKHCGRRTCRHCPTTR